MISFDAVNPLPDFQVADRNDLMQVESAEPLVVRDIWSGTYNSQHHQERVRLTIEVLRTALLRFDATAKADTRTRSGIFHSGLKADFKSASSNA
tara:strand:+ start:828 stop:1109 length:282 start_codon:yes stop_codon:yes gene_type:complete